MVASEREIIVLNRDTFAMLVPSGARVMLNEGTEVKITQALGNSFTVAVYGNLARIEGRDADALGKPMHNPLADLPPDASLQDKVWAQLKSVFDPEIPVNIVDLGLIYQCEFVKLKKDHYRVEIEMTLTAPGCGMGPVLVEDVHHKLKMIDEVGDVEVELVFDPPWNQEMMSDEARLQLGML